MNLESTKIAHDSESLILNADLVVKTLEDLGIKAAFGIPGGPVLALYNSLCASRTIKTTLCQHECGAAYMALGRSICRQDDNDIGLCFATAGPGATNLITGVAAAYSEKVPLFVLTANISTEHKGKCAVQDSFESGIDILSIFSKICGMSVSIKQTDNIASTIKELYNFAKNNRCPVHLNIPMNIATFKTNLSSFKKSETGSSAAAAANRQKTDSKKLLGPLSKFINSDRPVIFAGNGIKTSKYQVHLKEVAELLNIPVIVTSHAKGIFPENHYLFAGTFGVASPVKSRNFLSYYKPDAILFLGTRLGEAATSGWSDILIKPELKIQVDIDPNSFSKVYAMDHSINADILDALNYLINLSQDLLAKKEFKRYNLIETSQRFISETELFQNFSGNLTPQAVLGVLDFYLPDDSIIFSDIGNSMAWSINQLNIREGQDYYVMMSLGPMGSGLCGSIGAKTVLPKRPVICIVGDAATLMHGTELFTAGNFNIGVKILVLNDGGHGMVHHGSKIIGYNNCKVRYSYKAELAKFSESLGVRAYKASTMEELIKLPLENILSSCEPNLIELNVDPEIVPPILDRTKIVGQTES
jgi:acetolactate synthase I/II/III large subunit